MNKAFWNRIINASALLLFCSMVSTGTILKFILPPGSGRVEKVLAGSGREKTIDLLLGLSRHEWGEIHFYLSLGFLIILIIHLFLHWNWVRVTAWGTKQFPQPWPRKAVTLAITAFVIAALILPWIFKKETYDRKSLIQTKNIAVPVLPGT